MIPNRLSSAHIAALFGIAASLSACATAPHLGDKPVMRPAASIAAEQSFAGGQATGWPGGGWWNDYGDAQLSALIEEGPVSYTHLTLPTKRIV